jgi:excisionase family DNA binding protein
MTEPAPIMTLLAHRLLAPSSQDAVTARASGLKLSRYARQPQPLTLRFKDGDEEAVIELPVGAVASLLDILEAMAAGRGVTVVQDTAELSTVRAAEILNVSRPYLIKLVEDGALPHRKVGTHRRLRLEDVMAFKAAIDRERTAVLDQLARAAQEQEMGYDRR